MSVISRTFFKQARNVPNKPAIYCDENSISYEHLATLVNQWSSALQKKGVQHGDHIAILLPNCIEYVALMLVAANIGAVLVPLNLSLPPDAIRRACQTTNIKHIVATADLLQSFCLNQNCQNDQIFRMNSVIWFLSYQFLNSVKSDSDINGLWIASDDEPFILTMTSGSTGEPKPIILTQDTKLSRVSAAVEMYKITHTDRTLVATPLYHSLAERLVLIALLTGGTSILMPRFSPSEWIRTVEEKLISFTIAVSSQLSQIAHLLDDETHSQKVKSLRCVVSSSALLDTKIKENLISKLNCEFHECYGTSEIAIATNLSAEDAKLKLQSVGKAVPKVKIKILRENGTIAAPNEAGEIICKTPMIFSGYYGHPELTKDAMFGEYFRTGDMGKLDKDGFLYFLGRKKEIIITGGINVYPIDIESVISECTAVKESAAFPFPDEKLGEIIAVALVPKEPEHFKLRTVRFHCAERLADYQQPRKFFMVKELPKNNLGKIMKHILLSKYT
ncbi:MAG: hypothetical protein B6247_30095 [Candidatus Parabeggiatoa sp. nov. 2]|nr:MAG: hypothetical protein B6247_30095 [Beggiatoa sp. 4572_84]